MLPIIAEAQIIHHGGIVTPTCVGSVKINFANIDEELERLFAEWNAGSGQESDEFLATDCRSMNSGDVVRTCDQYGHIKHFLCDSIGWRKLTANEVLVWNAIPGSEKSYGAGDTLDQAKAAGCFGTAATTFYFNCRKDVLERMQDMRQNLAEMSLRKQKRAENKIPDLDTAERPY